MAKGNPQQALVHLAAISSNFVDREQRLIAARQPTDPLATKSKLFGNCTKMSRKGMGTRMTGVSSSRNSTKTYLLTWTTRIALTREIARREP